jgi:peptidoglycan/xylan/chitin deacetylase (PgdA/CDA1 family)
MMPSNNFSPDIVKVIMTHDIDWPIKGPGRDHILRRKDRFDEQTLSRIAKDENYNPYYGVQEIMELEEKHGTRSTFFFRPAYDNGSQVDQYSPVMRELAGKKWEVGVHVNNAELLSSIEEEKQAVERAADVLIQGSRVHYLNIRHDDLFLLEKAGIKYDSSVIFSKDSLDKRNTGYLIKGNLVVFPITLMDAYLFTYMHIPEERIVEQVDEALKLASDSGFMTILWHDNVLKMKGGRMYSKILEFLASRDDVEIVRGIDAYEHIISETHQ